MPAPLVPIPPAPYCCLICWLCVVQLIHMNNLNDFLHGLREASGVLSIAYLATNFKLKFADHTL